MPTVLDIVHKFYPNVTSVMDANNPIEVNVTKRDTQSKAVKNHTECALALACKREIGVDGVIIGVRTAYLIKGRTALRFGLAENTSREIVAFDRKGNFAPGEYELIKPFAPMGKPTSRSTRASRNTRSEAAQRGTNPQTRGTNPRTKAIKSPFVGKAVKRQKPAKAYRATKDIRHLTGQGR